MFGPVNMEGPGDEHPHIPHFKRSLYIVASMYKCIIILLCYLYWPCTVPNYATLPFCQTVTVLILSSINSYISALNFRLLIVKYRHF